MGEHPLQTTRHSTLATEPLRDHNTSGSDLVTTKVWVATLGVVILAAVAWTRLDASDANSVVLRSEHAEPTVSLP